MRSDHKMHLERLRGEVSVFGQHHTNQLVDVRQKIRGNQCIEIHDYEKLLGNFKERIGDCERILDKLSRDSVTTKVLCCGKLNVSVDPYSSVKLF